MFATLNVISVKIIDGNAPTKEFNQNVKKMLQKSSKRAYEFKLCQPYGDKMSPKYHFGSQFKSSHS